MGGLCLHLLPRCPVGLMILRTVVRPGCARRAAWSDWSCLSTSGSSAVAVADHRGTKDMLNRTGGEGSGTGLSPEPSPTKAWFARRIGGGPSSGAGRFARGQGADHGQWRSSGTAIGLTVIAVLNPWQGILAGSGRAPHATYGMMTYPSSGRRLSANHGRVDRACRVRHQAPQALVLIASLWWQRPERSCSCLLSTRQRP